MSEDIDKIFEMEDERREGMEQLLSDYLDTVHNDNLPETHNVKKWAAAELIMFLAYYVGDSHYEMIGILDECKDDLRKRHHMLLRSEDDE
jgi:hypothetical protein